MKPLSHVQLDTFRAQLYSWFEKNGRSLPWRNRPTPYRVLVSEVMLQQTQVDRVKPYFAAWMKQLPSFTTCARAPLSDILRLWQGLGYNRRAKMLHEAVKIVVHTHNRRLPTDPAVLQTLPGIGPATARSIAAFAFNAPTVFLETNVRTVLLHHFFKDEINVDEHRLSQVAGQLVDEQNPARWYSALMDYGTYLKKTFGNNTSNWKGYHKQSAFAGSNRQVRGKIIKVLSSVAAIEHEHLQELIDDSRFEDVIAQLIGEGLVQRTETHYCLGS